MSYQVLARKWRPHSFQHMVGQEAILRMLENALTQQRIHHAYLFTGTRGVGKTTLARIFTKCLNCEAGMSAKPCGTCDICKAIDAGQFLDLYEVDAASRTKVEDTRELLENVMYPPLRGKYKIYLIDEVHMLSNHSFNALLKTLEEPPAHVKFLLATTDPKRLPITILSRCLQFHLKRIPSPLIAKHLAHICEAEKITYEMPALEKLSLAADGSMRDALSLLDQAVAYSASHLSTNEMNDMLGNIAQDDIFPLLEALALQQGPALFAAINQLNERAPDFNQVLESLIQLLHQIAIIQILPSAITVNEKVAAIAKQLSPEEVQIYYQIALLGRRDLALVPFPQQGFEMTLLRMLAFKPNAALNQPKSSTPIASISPSSTVAKTSPVEAPKVTAPSTQDSNWRDIFSKLDLTGMAQALAGNCCLESIVENKITLTLSANHQPMLNLKLKERINEAFNRYFNKPMQLEIKISTGELMTPNKQQQAEQSAHLAQVSQTFMQDPNVKQLIDMYDATVDISLLPSLTVGSEK